MKPPYQKFYTIILVQPNTNIVDYNQVILHRRDYRKLKKQLNEIVYTDEKGEWALKSIAPNDRRPT
jgi:hypothetical protein